MSETLFKFDRDTSFDDLESIVTHSLEFFGLNTEEEILENVPLDSPSPVYIRNF